MWNVCGRRKVRCSVKGYFVLCQISDCGRGKEWPQLGVHCSQLSHCDCISKKQVKVMKALTLSIYLAISSFVFHGKTVSLEPLMSTKFTPGILPFTFLAVLGIRDILVRIRTSDLRIRLRLRIRLLSFFHWLQINLFFIFFSNDLLTGPIIFRL